MLARLPPADVLLAHSPPEGVNDEPDDRAHRGSPALRAWVERNRPAWLLHGHTLPNPARGSPSWARRAWFTCAARCRSS